jgi:probable HAF family extracellular repeat protein
MPDPLVHWNADPGHGARFRAAALLAALGVVALAGCKYDSYSPTPPALPTFAIQQLGLLAGGTQSQASAGSDAMIVGWATSGAGTRHAVVFTGGSAVALLEPSGAVSSEARGVNAAGVIVGFSTSSAGVRQALRWTSATSAPVPLARRGGAY